MNESPQQTGEGRAALGQRTAEILVAALFLAAGALVVWDSLRLGTKWADDGPEAGYFPFLVGLLICISAAINLVQAAVSKRFAGRTFVEVGQLKMVLAVLVPSAVYVGLIGWLGIYVASALFIAFFMRWLGKYDWWKLGAVAVGNSVFFFLVFEVWFKIPLPKGPLEALLRIN